MKDHTCPGIPGKLKILSFLVLSTLILLAMTEPEETGTPAMAEPTGSAVSAASVDMPFEEIPLPADKAVREFVYDPVKNALCMVCQSETGYQLLTLTLQNEWVLSSQWKISGNAELIHFVYGTDGKLYACRQTTNREKIKQTFIRLKKNGTISPVPLRSVNDVPKTSLDTSMEKKGKQAPHDITDIQSSGTALAVTYRNYAVKFYNAAEGGALGATSVTGEAHRNAFYNHQYLSATDPDSSADPSLVLTSYDIRTGETDHVITPASPIRYTDPFLISNYREHLFLLSEKGLFSGNFTGTVLQNVLTYEELSLPGIRQIRYFQAARDNIVYTAWLDNDAIFRLIRFTVPETSYRTTPKNKLDSLPSV